ncbi:hypothetical protein [Burkholderia ambifaria]|nr:hypothetical protein [Burkholderia ambifaria]
MLEELGREWPQFAFWILTGIDDWESGHVAPATALHLEPSHRTESAPATAYFAARVKRDNKRPSALPSGVSESFDKLTKQSKAIEKLGGHAAITELRDELVSRGVIEQPAAVKLSALRLSDLLKDTSDPVIDRAIEVLERELSKQQSTALAALKDARDADLLSRRRTQEDSDKKN